jgi:hypothetical protein
MKLFNSLDFCYKESLKKYNFLERKISIDIKANYILLYGPPKSGKTFLIIDYLLKLPIGSYLYIDLDDLRNDISEIERTLNLFIQQNAIKTVVIDNYNENFNLPILDKKINIVISTNKKSILPFKKDVGKIQNIFLMPLDFEEYLLFDKRHQSITQLFNLFLKYGNLPEISSMNETLKLKRLSDNIKLIFPTLKQQILLKYLSKNIGEKISKLQIFLKLKTEIKISKDSVYDLLKEYEENSIIFFISNFYHQKSLKKLYLYNYSFRTILNHQKNLQKVFENMVFLELKSRYKNIYFTDKIEFYISEKNLAIIPVAFILEEDIKLKITYIQNDLKKLNVTSVQYITFLFEYLTII